MDSIWKSQNIEKKETSKFEPIKSCTPLSDTLADTLRELRHEAGLTMMGLYEESGVAYNTISNYERGKFNPTVPTLELLLSALGYRLEIVKDDRSE